MSTPCAAPPPLPATVPPRPRSCRRSAPTHGSGCRASPLQPQLSATRKTPSGGATATSTNQPPLVGILRLRDSHQPVSQDAGILPPRDPPPPSTVTFLHLPPRPSPFRRAPIASGGSACITSTSHCQPPCAAPSSSLCARLQLNFPIPASSRPRRPWCRPRASPPDTHLSASGAPACRRVDVITTASQHADRAMAGEIDHGCGLSAHPFLPCSFLSFLVVVTCYWFHATS
ncbi:classical arabinogalactan protein 9-like [Triticum dicoccoides]|uniref:classical arabinogalactan protein 9-like n=1 Tax=Triticum dicoccoides TaxID=85692 RepID=UPI00188F8D6D|nr:classical arabinogalactan protein 9-like [Triticum dicoccoides]